MVAESANLPLESDRIPSNLPVKNRANPDSTAKESCGDDSNPPQAL